MGPPMSTACPRRGARSPKRDPQRSGDRPRRRSRSATAFGETEDRFAPSRHPGLEAAGPHEAGCSRRSRRSRRFFLNGILRVRPSNADLRQNPVERDMTDPTNKENAWWKRTVGPRASGIFQVRTAVLPREEALRRSSKLYRHPLQFSLGLLLFGVALAAAAMLHPRHLAARFR